MGRPSPTRSIAFPAGTGRREVAVFAAASETFSRRNTNRSIEESLDEYRQVTAHASAEGLRVRGYLSTAFGCPFEGPVSPARVLEVTTALLEMGVFEVAVSDTIGVAHPGQVRSLLDLLLRTHAADRLALPFHVTRGMAAAKVRAALDRGIRTFDASAGGLGGCPYAPGASGNLATEDLIYLLDGLGCETGVDIDRVAAASTPLEAAIGHPLPSRYLQARRATASRNAG
jgi:hydroxymethylglutaryl-CoA lyase